MYYKHYIPHFIFISTTLILLYTSNSHIKIIERILFLNGTSLANIRLQYSRFRMKAYDSYNKYDYEEDDATLTEYTESSVEAYFNEYLRIEQKYSMRPRYGIARAMIERSLRDEAIENFDKSMWYACDPAKMPSSLQPFFTQLHLDEETQEFLDASAEKSNAVFTQVYYTVAKLCLSPFLSQTSINGLLRRGSMFVVSSVQFEQLLGTEFLKNYNTELSLIDLGAGDGATTKKMSPYFNQVFATEISAPMRWILEKSGFTVLGLTEWHTKQYDVIACLNLLDRCDTPLQLLKQIKASLKPNGRLLIALSLPYSPYVETTITHDPSELLPIDSSQPGIEHQISQVVSRLLEPLGFELLTWSKVPYLCEGDMKQAYYWLTDILFVCKVKS